MDIKFFVIHPSRQRPRQALATRAKWLERCNWRVTNYLFSFDSDDDSIPKSINGLRLPNTSAIEAINNAAKSRSDWDVLVVVSDDFDCPYDWDLRILDEIKGNDDFVLKTVDGLQKTLVTLPIMSKKYYDRYGYVYHPEFRHMASDVELTAVAMMTGKLIKSDLVFRHLHYSTGITPMDAVNKKNDSTYKQGDEVLAKHRANNFGIENPVMKYEEIEW